MPTEAN